MHVDSIIRTPWHKLPISILMKSREQKVYRKIHCLSCGMPIGDITDQVLMLSDSSTPVAELHPDHMGVIEVHCPRHTCKQYFRYEFTR